MKAIVSFLLSVFFLSSAVGQAVSGHIQDLQSKYSRTGVQMKPNHKAPQHSAKHRLPYTTKKDWKKKLQNTDVIKQRLDSVLSQVQPPIKALENSSKVYYYYNAGGSQVSDLSYQWNSSSQEWYLDYKDDYSYNANADFTQVLISQWDQSGNQWEEVWKKEFYYNAGNDLDSALVYIGTGIPVVWSPQYKSAYQWDMNGNMLSDYGYIYNPDSAVWVNDFKMEFIYNANADLERETDAYWNLSLSQWIPVYKYEFSYNMSWQNTLTEEFSWDPDSSQWDNSSRTEFTYNPANYLGQALRYSWNISDSAWEWSYKNDFDYNPAGNMIQETASFWDTFNLSWEYGMKNELSYDSAFTYSDLVLPASWGDFEYFSPNMLRLQHASSFYNSNWHDSYQYTYYYNPVTITGIEHLQANTARVFPNPASSILVFDWDGSGNEQELEISDLAGKSVMKQKIQRNASVDISQLKDGLYLYRLKDKGNEFCFGKFCVIR